MPTRTTNGIRIHVETTYRQDYSKPLESRFIFSYHIKIENKSEHAVQLISRQWLIVDSTGEKKVVEGDGVIGEQPVLNEGTKYEYESWCPLTSEIGMMRGTYLMERCSDKYRFRVSIPEFKLIAPFKLN